MNSSAALCVLGVISTQSPQSNAEGRREKFKLGQRRAAENVDTTFQNGIIRTIPPKVPKLYCWEFESLAQ